MRLDVTSFYACVTIKFQVADAEATRFALLDAAVCKIASVG
jgi:hypothetical protein